MTIAKSAPFNSFHNHNHLDMRTMALITLKFGCIHLGNTGLVGGAVGLDNELILSLEKMKSIYQINTVAGTITCDRYHMDNADLSSASYIHF
jgi:hypothetical protein